ncbi:hypothetical protein [Polaribacter sargassicola]|uniref:hypothetical protein n=1 Tax=Polaribacter sargassicola TaxID=2836891 RepID=UPI001F44309B|nr:hypothetical protein [Polaribacter sp. DS7-9]MCG1037052.1 hypothetical protein [Polaribacter sp. DS7-9]
MIKKLLLFFTLFLSFSILSQNKKVLLFGKIVDSVGVVKNANVVNLKTNQGTFSSDSGGFHISVSEGDSLQISSVQHITLKLVINKKIVEDKTIIINLISNVYVLDEFDLRKHNLSGNLGVDVNDIPKEKKDSLLRVNMDFSNVDFSVVDQRIDENIRAMPKVVNTVSNTYQGINAGKIIGKLNPFKKSNKSTNINEAFNQKKVIPLKILSELGEDFFFDKLKIPEEKYYHFLQYCNNQKIEQLYKENKVLDIIQIFQQESTNYLKLLEKK